MASLHRGLLLLLLAIAGCGQKGPLVLPDSKVHAPVKKGAATAPVPADSRDPVSAPPANANP